MAAHSPPFSLLPPWSLLVMSRILCRSNCHCSRGASPGIIFSSDSGVACSVRGWIKWELEWGSELELGSLVHLQQQP